MKILYWYYVRSLSELLHRKYFDLLPNQMTTTASLHARCRRWTSSYLYFESMEESRFERHAMLVLADAVLHSIHVVCTELPEVYVPFPSSDHPS